MQIKSLPIPPHCPHGGRWGKNLTGALQNPSWWTQSWYAADASAAGTLDDLYEWFTLLCDQGPAYGYFPKPSKCVLVDDCSKITLKIYFPLLVSMLLLAIGSLKGLLVVRMRCCHMYLIRFNMGLIM